MALRHQLRVDLAAQRGEDLGVALGVGRAGEQGRRVAGVGLGGVVEVGCGDQPRRHERAEVLALRQRVNLDAARGRGDALVGIDDVGADLVVDFVEGQRQADRHRHAGSAAQ